jgi:hypothetical protein
VFPFQKNYPTPFYARNFPSLLKYLEMACDWLLSILLQLILRMPYPDFRLSTIEQVDTALNFL